MIDQELLNACVVNSWSVVPRMMLADSMIESGYSEFKAMEAFEPPPVSKHLPLTYSISSGRGNGIGNCLGLGCGLGYVCGLGGGIGFAEGDGSGGREDGHGDGYSNDKGYRYK